MQLTDISHSPSVAPAPPAASQGEAMQHCDECGAPVDPNQRYCVVCGAHRRHVNDPAARYLSQATARSRSAKAPATGRRAGARSRGVGVALAIALIPVAAAAGVIAGRSSNNDDGKLIQALARRQSGGVSTATTASTATANRASSAAASSHTKAGRHAKKGSSNATPSVKNAGKALSTTQNGTAAQITGFKATKAQEQQGASATKKVQKSTGKSYVTGQNNLPSQVVVP